MVKKLVLGGVLGGTVLFAWGALSWMAIPWHDATLSKFVDGDAVLEVVAANADGRGIYILPFPYGTAAPEEGALAFVAFDPRGGSKKMGPFMARGWAIQIAAAGILTAAALLVTGSSFWPTCSRASSCCCPPGIGGGSPRVTPWSESRISLSAVFWPAS